MGPLVTVAVAAYNVSEFLKKGMGYVLNQTYENLDIILVDDGSTDATPKLCDEIVDSDGRVRVFHKENGGLGSARNVGIENAKGEFIYFFDVDDSIDLDLIENAVADAQRTKADLIIFGFTAELDGSNERETIGMKEELITDNNRLKEKYCTELLFTKHGNGFAWNKFYKKSFIDKYGFRFGNQRIQQDEPFNMQLYPKLERVYVSAAAPYHYVIYSKGNAGSRYLPNRFEIMTDVYHKFMDFYKNWQLDNEKVLDYIYNRYASGIYQSVTANCFHKDNNQSLAEKHKYIKDILNNPEARQCVERVYANSSKDPIAFCIKNDLPRCLMAAYKSKLILKRLIRRRK